jgi:hypothetical protein
VNSNPDESDEGDALQSAATLADEAAEEIATDTLADETAEEIATDTFADETAEEIATDAADGDPTVPDAELTGLTPTAQVIALDAERDPRVGETRFVDLNPQLFTARFSALESDLFLQTFLFNSLYFELYLDDDHSTYSMQSIRVAPLGFDGLDDNGRLSGLDTENLNDSARGLTSHKKIYRL